MPAIVQGGRGPGIGGQGQDKPLDAGQMGTTGREPLLPMEGQVRVMFVNKADCGLMPLCQLLQYSYASGGTMVKENRAEF